MAVKKIITCDTPGCEARGEDDGTWVVLKLVANGNGQRTLFTWNIDGGVDELEPMHFHSWNCVIEWARKGGPINHFKTSRRKPLW